MKYKSYDTIMYATMKFDTICNTRLLLSQHTNINTGVLISP